MKQRIIFLCIVSLILGSCGDFLEPKSKSEFVPKDANSLSELLLGEAYPRNNITELNVFLHLLDDDIAQLLIKKCRSVQMQTDGMLLTLGNPTCMTLWVLPERNTQTFIALIMP